MRVINKRIRIYILRMNNKRDIISFTDNSHTSKGENLNKEVGITIIERMLDERRQLEKQIQEVEEKLKVLPKGKLVCCSDSKHTKYYQSDGHQKVYISKSEKMLAEQLAIKKYLTLLKQELLNQLNAVNAYLKHHKSQELKSLQFLAKIPEFSDKIKSFCNPQMKEIQEWIKESYDTNRNNPEKLVFKSASGNVLRSKSEYMIDVNLNLRGIPYRYECALELGDVVYYPDFTICHPKTGKIYYWEHLGLMDNHDYVTKVISKLRFYCENGIIPGINLILTSETKDVPLNPRHVEELIECYFCM